jgi:hypothetical protein
MRLSRPTLGCLVAIGGVALSLSANAFAKPRHAANVESAPAAHAPKGRQVEAPAWSFACMTDHGPSPCGEPMWIYE